MQASIFDLADGSRPREATDGSWPREDADESLSSFSRPLTGACLVSRGCWQDPVSSLETADWRSCLSRPQTGAVIVSRGCWREVSSLEAAAKSDNHNFLLFQSW